MALRLPEYPVDTQDIVQDFVKQNKRHVQFFFIKHLKNTYDFYEKSMNFYWRCTF